MAFDPADFAEELDRIKRFGIAISPEKLKISSHCSVITAYHKLLDAQREAQDSLKIGTTAKGVGPAYEDKAARRGPKLKDLLDRKGLEEKIRPSVKEKEVLV